MLSSPQLYRQRERLGHWILNRPLVERCAEDLPADDPRREWEQYLESPGSLERLNPRILTGGTRRHKFGFYRATTGHVIGVVSALTYEVGSYSAWLPRRSQVEYTGGKRAQKQKTRSGSLDYSFYDPKGVRHQTLREGGRTKGR
ncbi:hypothetical protein L207DRAFT_340661 [Hyaloscypha variabilis F]|uniref:Uncharacterized protein n=1 Tax=Hyaloscypha variabilis (strain UAMH 11265 / GT02V1 / F) TaxID=1149755 RepID=A0A2J6RPU7_HYAVF|nr:hypothetical protein L207DRAFT_340661 [Hyaloscypha variabilis F]